MARSGLTTNYVPASSKNYTQGRSRFGKIERITLHHVAGTSLPGGIFQNSGRGASAHYGVNHGSIENYVDESDIAWSDGLWDSNKRTVSMEIVNSTIDGYLVADDTISSVIKLVADIAKRNGLGTLVKGKNIFGHRDFKATFCPGDYLYKEKFDHIIAEVNKLIGSSNVAPQATVTPTNTISSGNPGKVKVYGTKYINNDPYIGKVAAFMRKEFRAYTPATALGNYYGPKITAAIKEFQHRTNLTVDGNFAANGETIQMLRRYGFKG